MTMSSFDATLLATQSLVLDTNAVIHIYIIRHPPALNWFDQAVKQRNIIVPSTVIDELMLNKNPHGGLLVRKRDILIVQHLLDVCQFDAPTVADYYNALARVSASYGKATLGFADALIAECVLRNRAQLCTFDADFSKGVPELRPLIVQPYAPPLIRAT